MARSNSAEVAGAARDPRVDAYIEAAERWGPEIARLRSLLLCTPLTEGFKWRQPCYTIEGANVVLINAFRDSCALLFFKGALLSDPEDNLVRPGENSHAGRRIHITGVKEIDEWEPVLVAYLGEAVEVERAGLSVDPAERPRLDPPAELLEAFERSPDLRSAFGALTPGRQRGYLLHFADAKRSATRASRIEKCAPRILAGKGLRDR